MSKRIEKDWFFNAALGTHIEISKKNGKNQQNGLVVFTH